jgi:hypothetical protein
MKKTLYTFFKNYSKKLGLILALVIVMVMISCGDIHVSGKPGVDETSNGLSIVVQDSLGLPRAYARVMLRPNAYLPTEHESSVEGSGMVNGYTNDKGILIIDGLAPGVYKVIAESADLVGQSHAEVFTAHQNFEVAVLVQSSATISGNLNLPPGYTEARAAIVGTPYWVWTDAMGNFELNGLPAGQLDLVFVIDETILAEAQLTANAGQSIKDPELELVQPAISQWQDSLVVMLDAVAAGVDEAVKEIPILIQLTDSNFPEDAGVNGASLRIFDNRGRTIPFQISYWDEVAKIAHIWAYGHRIEAVDDQHLFSIYWNHPAVYPVENSASVFDTARGWSGVWHMTEAFNNDANILVTPDATAFGLDGVITGAPDFGTLGAFFDGNLDRIAMGGSSTNFGGATMTMQVWVQTDKEGAVFLEKQDSSEEWDHKESIFYFGRLEENLPQIGWFPTWLSWNSPNNYYQSPEPVIPREWTFLTIRRTYNVDAAESNARWYINAHRIEGSDSVFAVENDDPADSLRIGASSSERRFAGSMRFLHISRVPRTESFIRLSYQTQKPDQNVLRLIK